MITMNAVEVRDDIAKLLETAAEEPVMIESAGKPSAVVLSLEAYHRLAAARPPRQFGCGRHLLSGSGVNVNDLLAVPVDDVFADYLPDNSE